MIDSSNRAYAVELIQEANRNGARLSKGMIGTLPPKDTDNPAEESIREFAETQAKNLIWNLKSIIKRQRYYEIH